MITEEDLSQFGFGDIEMFFDHAIDLTSIGNEHSADACILGLSALQKKQFLAYLNKLPWSEDVHYCFNKALDLI